MKPYDTLIKLSKEELDKKRRELGILLDQKDRLLKARQELGESLIRERDYAAENPENSYTFPGFAKGVKIKEEEIDRKVAFFDEHIEKMSELISVAFSELKKYEIINEKKEKELLAEEARKERIMLDEMGLNSFQRKNEAIGN